MASTKVRGITIELGADTSGLSKALKNVNSEIKTTQKQLKDVERLLKLDPKNTELLEQKQRLLGERIGETRTKLEALKEAQKQVGEELEKTGKGQEQYDALTREIVSCTNELEDLEKQASKTYQAFEKIAAAGEKLKEVGGKIEDAGKSLRYVSAAAAGLLTGIVKTTAEFDASMSKVAAISGAAGEEFDSLREKAREMGATTKFTATESAEAMNYMAMAGWKTEDMLSGISGIMNLAAASGEDLATTSDIVTDALTAFGLTAKDSSRFADILASAASNANTNVAMMGESFKYVAPVAGSLGYTAEDIAIALGLMANSGIKASMAGTSLRNIFNRMAKPTKESAAAMSRLGIAIDDGAGHMYSFREIMDQIRDGFVEINMPIEEYDRRVELLDEQLAEGSIKQKKYAEALEELNKQAFGAAGAEKARAAAMLGGTRAMSGLLAIANASEEDYQKLTEAIDNSSQAFARTKDGVIPLNEALASGIEILDTYQGSAEAMAGTMLDNTAGQTEILKSQLQELAISIGDTLTPALSDLISKAQGFVDKLNGMDDGTKKAMGSILIFTAVLSPLLIIVGKLTTAIGSLMQAFGNLGAAIGTSAGVIALVIAWIAAFAAAVYMAVEHADKFAIAWDQTWAKIKGFFESGTEFIREKTGAFGEMFATVIESTQTIFRGFINHMHGLVETLAGLITGDWDRMLKGMKLALFGYVDEMVGFIAASVNLVIGRLNQVIEIFNKLASLDISRIPLFTPRISEKWAGGLAEGGVVPNGYSALVGEAGPEILTVAGGSATVTPLTSAGGDTNVIGLLETYLPYLAAGNTLVLDSGALVGGIAPDMNAALGTIAIRGGRR